MNSDVLRIIFDLLADCRAAGLCCTEWYAAYLLTPDAAVWLGPKSAQAARVLPKMYPNVWRGSVFELAAAGNNAPILKFSAIVWMGLGPSIRRLLEIACKRCDLDLLRWLRVRASLKEFDRAVGQYLSEPILAAAEFDCSLRTCLKSAARAGNVPMLWYSLTEYTGAEQRFLAELLKRPGEMPVKTVGVALAAGLVRGIVERQLVRHGSAPVLEFLKQHGHATGYISMARLVKYYARGEHERVLWYCNNVAVPNILVGASMEHIHDIMVCKHDAIGGVPDDYIIARYNPCGGFARLAIVRKSMRLLIWLIDGGISIETICERWDHADPTNWIFDRRLRLQIERTGMAKYSTTQEFRDKCVAIGCDEADRATPAGMLELFARRDVLGEFGRWDLILSPRWPH